MEFEVVFKNQFSGIGLSWEGTFQQAANGEIREIIRTLLSRVEEIEGKVNPQQLLGLSNYKDPTSNRFTHYSVVEVEDGTEPPAGMIKVEIPTLRYVKTFHLKDTDIQSDYTKTFDWIKENGYKLHTEYLTHLEIYPMSEEAYSTNPPFTIMIPIQ